MPAAGTHQRIFADGVFADGAVGKMNAFEKFDITGKNLLAIKYREFVTKLKYCTGGV